jgi:hypothetical protein
VLGAKYVSTAVRQFFGPLPGFLGLTWAIFSAIRVFDFVLQRTLLVPLIVQLAGDIADYYRVRSLPMGCEFESQPTVDFLQVRSSYFPLLNAETMF